MTNFIARGAPVVWLAGTSSGPADPADERPETGQLDKAVVAAVGLAVLARIARDRRTYERVILVALVAVAAAGATQAGTSRSIARLVAWIKAQDLAEERRLKAMRSKKSLARDDHGVLAVT